MKYSWTIDGSKIKDNNEIDFSITNNSEYIKKISELSNYADGINLNFKYSGDLPKNTKIKVFVGEKYNDNDLINIYYYNKKLNKLEMVKDKLKVKDKYVEFELDHCSEYFMTPSKIVDIKNQIKEPNIFIILFIIETLAIITFIIIKIIKNKEILINKFNKFPTFNKTSNNN